MDGTDHIRAELAAQGFDVAVDGTGAGCVRPTPDLGQQALSGQDGPRTAGQVTQQVELDRCQVDLDPGSPYPSFGGVDFEIAHDDDRTGGAASAASCADRSSRRSSACTRAASSRNENGLVR